MKRNSMKRLLALVLCSLLIAGSIGITAMAESDDTYLYVGGGLAGHEAPSRRHYDLYRGPLL